MVEIRLKTIIWKMRSEKKTKRISDITEFIKGFLEYHTPKKYPT